jgi:hypothetical protein
MHKVKSMTSTVARFDKRMKCIMLGNEALVGLNPALKTAFYPHYRYQEATQGTLVPQPPWPPHMPKSAIQRGLLLDRVVGKLTSLPSRLYPTIKPQDIARRVQTWLNDAHLTPKNAQCVVADPAVRAGTLIDLVCHDREGRAVLLEFKCGYRSYKDCHTGKPMNPPFWFLDDSPQSQHQLYLGYAVYMFERTHPETRVNREQCAVVYVGPEDILSVPLPSWAQCHGLLFRGASYIALQKSWTRTKRKRHQRSEHGKAKRLKKTRL